MNTIETKAYAKLNLTLDITGRRADGYHDLDMVMISCGLHDVIRIHLDTGKPWQLRSNRPELSDGPNDLTWRAAETYFARTGISCTGLTLSPVPGLAAAAVTPPQCCMRSTVSMGVRSICRHSVKSGCSWGQMCRIAWSVAHSEPWGKGSGSRRFLPCRIVGYCSVNRRFLFQHRSYSGLSTPEMIFRTPIVGQWQRPSAHRI